MVIKIGDTLWDFSINRRSYDKSHGEGPIFAKHFAPVQVTGETKVSWLVGPSWSQSKVNKKHIETGNAGAFYTEQGMNDKIYEHENAHRIADAIRHLPAQKLREIAALIGYKART